MGDKDRPFSFEGMKLEIIDGDGFKELPIVEDSVEYSVYYDAPELRKSMDSISFNFKTDNPNMTQFGKILGEQMQSQIDNAMRSSVIIQSEPKIIKPKNLKYPNKKRKMRVWKKWCNRYGWKHGRYIVIPRARCNGVVLKDGVPTISYTAEEISK